MHNMCVLQYCLEKIIGEKKMFLSGDEKKTLYRHYGKKTKNKKIIVYSSLCNQQINGAISNQSTIMVCVFLFFILVILYGGRRNQKPFACISITNKQAKKQKQTNKPQKDIDRISTIIIIINITEEHHHRQ